VADERLSDLLESQEQIIEVEFDNEVDEVLLNKISDINKIENIDNKTWRLFFKTREDRRSNIFDFAHQNGLRTLQLSRKIVSLQTLFQNLTN
jgi:ABC-2 type transport system ATP-binding protein